MTTSARRFAARLASLTPATNTPPFSPCVRSVDLVALRECFPNIFECFETMSAWSILSALEATQMDENKAIRNIKAKQKVRSARA